MFKPDSWIKFSWIQLINKGDKPVVLDWVRLVPYPPKVYQHSKVGADIKMRRVWYAVAKAHQIVPNVHDPQVLKSMVPAKGAKVPPFAAVKPRTPALIMEIGPGDAPVSGNQGFKVGYHTLDGKRYVATFYVYFLMCTKGEISRTKCDKIWAPGT